MDQTFVHSPNTLDLDARRKRSYVDFLLWSWLRTFQITQGSAAAEDLTERTTTIDCVSVCVLLALLNKRKLVINNTVYTEIAHQ